VLTTDGSTTYKDIASYTDFLAAGYAIDYNGTVYDGKTKATLGSDGKYYTGTLPTGVTAKENNVTLNFARLCKDAYGATTEPTASSEVEKVITNLINSGLVTLVSAKTDGTFANEEDDDFDLYETSVSTNTGLQEVSDESELKKAEAKYEADMKKIDRKDSKYDSDLAALETERTAIKDEMDTLKTVAKDNVERTFKIFS
jgi:hypothetical protein